MKETLTFNFDRPFAEDGDCFKGGTFVLVSTIVGGLFSLASIVALLAAMVNTDQGQTSHVGSQLQEETAHGEGGSVENGNKPNVEEGGSEDAAGQGGKIDEETEGEGELRQKTRALLFATCAVACYFVAMTYWAVRSLSSACLHFCAW
jgi:hypothetical protein